MKLNTIVCLGAFVLILTPSAFADSTYNFICGHDEDGCTVGDPSSCVCVSDLNQQDRCLDLQAGRCMPVNVHGSCAAGQHLFASQASCLTMLWESSIHADSSKNCHQFNYMPSASYCAVKCTSLFDCKPT